MTAKPHPSSQDGADDLIAELAKLMAQDASGDKPAAPVRPATPIRIPGDNQSAAPLPRFDFGDVPRVSPAEEKRSEPEPFRLNLDFNAPKSAPVVAGPSSPIPAAPAAPAPQQRQPEPQQRQPEPQQSAPDAAEFDHDSIADLIAAELMADNAPQSGAPTPRPAEPVAPQQPPRSVATPVATEPSFAGQPKPAAPEQQPSEQDRFSVAPVFGLATRSPEPSSAPITQPIVPARSEAPARAEPSMRSEPQFRAEAPTRSEPSFVPPPTPAAPSQGASAAGRDPIDEIESLIGSAVQVGRAPEAQVPPPSPRPAPSPALRSLATPTLPTETGRKLTGADEAILAAAEATGVQIGWVDPTGADEQDFVAAAPVRERRPRRGLNRALVGPLVAITLLLAAGFGLYWVLGLGSRDPGEAPLLTADTTPVKETPTVDPEASTPQQSVVFNEIDGVVPGAEEQLVSRDQADVNEVTQVPPTEDVSQEGLANRKVRTVTVRPDGTIVSGDDTVAGSNILPVDRPNVPEVPGADTSIPSLIANSEPANSTASTTPAATPTPEPAAAPAQPVAQPGSTVPAVDTTGNPIQGKTTVIPLMRPSGLSGPGAAEVNATAAPTSPVNAVVNSGGGANMLPPPPGQNLLGLTPTAQTSTPAAAAPAQSSQLPAGATEVAAVSNDAPAYVQLASQRSEAEARSTAQAMVSRFGSLFNGANMQVQRVDLGDRGIYYRVRVPANSLQEANTMCNNVKAAGGDCFTM